MPMLELITGYETFAPDRHGRGLSGSVKISASWTRNAEDWGTSIRPLVGPESVRNNGPTMIGGRGDAIQASRVNYNQGLWTTTRWNCPEGSFFILRIDRRGHGEQLYNHAKFLYRMRESAGLTQLRVELVGHPDANLDVANIQGQMDYIMPEEFTTFGLPLDDIENFCHSPDDYFQTIILEPQSRPRPRVTAVQRTPDGRPTMPVVGSPRRINIRSKRKP